MSVESADTVKLQSRGAVVVVIKLVAAFSVVIFVGFVFAEIVGFSELKESTVVALA